MHRAHRHTPFVSQSLRGPPENPDRKGCACGIDFQTPHLLSSRDPGLQLSPSSRTRSRQTEKVPEREGHATPKPWRPAPPSRRSGRRVPLRGPHGKARLLEGGRAVHRGLPGLTPPRGVFLGRRHPAERAHSRRAVPHLPREGFATRPLGDARAFIIGPQALEPQRPRRH